MNETTQACPIELHAILRKIITRLTSIEQMLAPPVVPASTGRCPFRQPGKPVSAAEYESRTGVPRVAVALALHLLQYPKARIAERIGVHRGTLLVGLEFKAYREGVVAMRRGNGVARRCDDD